MSTSTVTAVPPSPLSLSSCAPRPLQLLDNNIPSPLDSPTLLSSPRASTSHGLSTPPPTARNFKPGSARRQSSISYFPSDHVASPNCRSPTFPLSRPSPRRSNSVGVWDDEGASMVSWKKGNRRSLGQLTAGKESSSPGPAVDRGPLTLTEKHADLLQFIAQKEAKCLELRSHLATHETELAQLKRKWERIVSRGMDRAYAGPGAPSPSTPAAAVSAIIPTASAALKEGARLLAAGLDLSVTELGPPSPSPLASPLVPISGFATVSRASMASSPAMRKVTARHQTTQSMSSASTTSSSTRASTPQSSQRLSQSSASSLMSALSLEDPIEESSVDPSPVLSPFESQQLLRRRSQDGDNDSQAQLTLVSVINDATRRAADSSYTPKNKVRPASMALASLSASSVPTPVTAWMGSMGTSVGRKWEEIQKGEAFTKSQKRASVLLSDVSQSFFAALASPSPSATPSPLLKPSPLSSIAASSSTSLLDDESEQLGTEQFTLGAVLVPSRITASPTPSPVQMQKTDIDDDEDWNW